MDQPESVYVKLVLNTIYKKFHIDKRYELSDDVKLKERGACFVTFHTLDGDLRGCIGTIEPYRENLKEEIVQNTISAAFNDPRFEPITKEEIENIYGSVDLLSPLEQIFSLEDLDPKKYGLMIVDRDRKGVLLPNLDGVDTVEQQIEIVLKKAGIINEGQPLMCFRFTSDRYY